MKIDLTTSETEILLGALSSYLSDLRMEIGATDSPRYRQSLKQERSTLESIAATLNDTASRRTA